LSVKLQHILGKPSIAYDVEELNSPLDINRHGAVHFECKPRGEHSKMDKSALTDSSSGMM